jgi:DNA mismatch repair protein MutS2
MMARAGLLLPADEGSRLYLYDDIFLELGDSQNLVANLSTFSGHIMGLKPIIEQASKRALVLLDEIAAGTEPQAGAALAQAILEDLAQSGATTVVTTHFDSLKGMALGDQRFRNASMEYAADTLRPTYKLILDVPGQSFGIEMAQQIGLKDSIINRAQSLRGNQAARIDETLNVLAKLRRDLERRNDELQARVVELEASKSHWQREKDELGTARKALAAQITARYEEDLSAMRLEYEDIVDSLKKQLKLLERSTSSDQSDVKAQIQELRQKADRQLTAMNASVQNLKPKEVPAGRKVSISELKLGLQVIVSSLAKPGVIQRIGGQSDIEVRVGVMNVRVEIDDLIHADVAAKPKPSSRQASSAAPIRSQASVPYTPKTATNSIDLRGLEADVAGEAVLRFLDQCFRRGESQIVIIHGHGSNRVKHEVRQVLADCRDYELSFRPGEEGEGGDGVTIVLLHR